jgi:N-acetylmuramoyl-L-alanine amidase
MSFLKLSFLIIFLLFTACSNQLEKRKVYWVDHSQPSVSFDSGRSFLIMHYTAVDYEESMRLLATDAREASAHYVVTKHPTLKKGKPVVLQLVNEQHRAWHAGASQWGSSTSLNNASIGIEIINYGFTEEAGRLGITVPGEEWHWYPYPEEQMHAVMLLAKDIITRHEIEPHLVLAHSDIAPQRKNDPGPLFPWEWFYEQGVGAWHEQETVDNYIAGRELTDIVPMEGMLEHLAMYGYKVPDLTDPRLSAEEQTKRETEAMMVVRAFQMHFRPHNFSGVPDVESEAIALALIERYRTPKI